MEVDIEPGKEYRLVAAAWGVGDQDRFWISAAAKGLEFDCLESPAPDEAAAMQMASNPMLDGPEAKCVKCGLGPIRGTATTNTITFRGR